ncbi:MAG: AraC family transcriptional regulator [Thermoanaerobaculia bacterium]|jgi:AraC family transcriptional regulator|nr:AraC family transcriptional regulator [Thermoanaerobaculia bacterium]
MTTAITGPTVAPGVLQFDPVSSAAAFPRVARLPRNARVSAADARFGTLLRRVELPASSLTSTAYPPQLRLTPHTHTGAFLLFVRDGGFIEEHNKGRERCDRFSCIYRPAFDEHANEFDDGGAVLAAVDLGPAWVTRLRDAGFNGERFRVRSPFVDQFGDRLDAELAAPDSMSEIVIESLATEVIVFASRLAGKSGGGRNAWPERARRLIEEEFASPLSLGGIASEVGVHPVHLARQFRASQGCTVGEYIRRVHVGFARRELVMTSKPIAEIALAAGFFDQSQLTKTFKRVTGRTPAAYRAQHR